MPDRLAVASLVFTVAFFLAWAAAPPAWRVEGAISAFDAAMGLSVASSLLVLYLSRLFRARPERVITVGLWFQIVCCLFVAVVEHWLPWPDTYLVRGVSWNCMVILAFTLTVPAAPFRTLLFSMAAASMGLVGLGFASLRGHPWPSTSALAGLLFPSYLAAGVAVVLSRLIYKLGGDVTKALKMGNYELEHELGKGGMGEVWRAKHRLLPRPAAVKFVRPQQLGPLVGEDPHTICRRFEREARSTAMLSSPHTISIYDYGVTSQGTFYYVMELLDGLDLETMVSRFGPLPAERVVYLMKQVCYSLAEAHQAGMVHRDIKPANIYVCRPGVELDFVKVLDFGLVISDVSAKQQLTRLTTEGLATGTPAYMAPEMAGNAKIDLRADIYGLGCVAYFLLTGQVVFDSKSTLKVLADHVSTLPKPPSLRTELPIPEDVEALVLACLEKDPARRPQTALELARSLDDCPLATPWTQARAERWWRTNQPRPEASLVTVGDPTHVTVKVEA